MTPGHVVVTVTNGKFNRQRRKSQRSHQPRKLKKGE